MKSGIRTGGWAWAALALAALPGVRAAEPAFTSYDAVKDVLALFAGRLPAELADPNPAKWDAWNRRNDQLVRSRLDAGDLDSMVNLLLFGTSFTKQPRIRLEDLGALARSGVLNARVTDLVQGLAAPGKNERLAILRDLLAGKGLAFTTDAERKRAGVFVLQNLTRVLGEKQEFAARSSAAVENAKAGTPQSILSERSELFRDRGVSLDTGILADFSVDLALQRMKEQGRLRPGQVARVAVIGPGLAFIDKDESAAFDYFPPQTIQPFAVMDSLLRLGLADSRALSLTALDISPLVLGHLQRARQQAEKGNGYVIQLPQDASRSWPPALEDYWKSLGDRIAVKATPLPPPAVFGGLKTRAIRVRPEVVLKSRGVAFDMVAERIDLAPAERFDLVIATNVFLYYDSFQQSLALQNVGSMMKPGGLLLSNDALPLLPPSGMTEIGVSAVSDGAAGRDAVAAYLKK